MMLRLTALLCFAMFVTLQVGGNHDTLRPGLAAAQMAAAAPQVVAKPRPSKPEVQVIAASFTPEDQAVEAALAMPLVQAAVEQAAPEPVADTVAPVWVINARSVNVREGPSTEYAVVGKLTKGEAATVLYTEANGWARILIEGDGIEGFVSVEFLSPESSSN